MTETYHCRMARNSYNPASVRFASADSIRMPPMLLEAWVCGFWSLRPTQPALRLRLCSCSGTARKHKLRPVAITGVVSAPAHGPGPETSYPKVLLSHKLSMWGASSAMVGAGRNTLWGCIDETVTESSTTYKGSKATGFSPPFVWKDKVQNSCVKSGIGLRSPSQTFCFPMMNVTNLIHCNLYGFAPLSWQ